MELLKIVATTLLALLLVDQCRCSCITDGDRGQGTNATLSTLSDAILDYTLKQYKNLVQDEKEASKNIFTSPYSIWSALTLTYLGSRGVSSNELRTLLDLEGIDKAAVEQASNALRKELKSDEGATFLIANKLAIDKGANFRKCVANNPYLEVEAVNFASKPNKERVRLNDWVEENTQGKIEDLLPNGSISEDTLMVILNAVYFKGSWLSKFKTQLTRKRDFTSSSGEVKKVDMMFQRSEMSYSWINDLGIQAVDLPYSDGKYSMTVMLPNEDETVDQLVLRLDSNKLKNLGSSFNKVQVALFLPKFKIESSYQLKETLKKLGAGTMFSKIDISGYVTSRLPIYVANVIHKAFVEVNEEGTEAAAATAVIFNTRSGRLTEQMNVNRPFVFLLRQIETNTVLFMGVVRNL